MDTVQKYIKGISHTFENEKALWRIMVFVTLTVVIFTVCVSWYQFLWATDETVIVPQNKSIRTGMTVQDIEQIEKEHVRRSEEYSNIIKEAEEQKVRQTQKDAKK